MTFARPFGAAARRSHRVIGPWLVVLLVVPLMIAGCSDGGRRRSPPASVGAGGTASGSVTTPGAGPGGGGGGAGSPPPPPPPPTSPPPPPPAANGVPRWPVVLVRGAHAIRLRGVPAHLQAMGVTVLDTTTSPFQTIDHRKHELADQILSAFPDPATKVNLVAQSMGGIDSRAFIAMPGMAERVATLTTVSTPHRGTPIADAAVGLIPANVQAAIDTFMNVLGMDWNQVNDLSVAHMTQVFNPAHPDDPRIEYRSWAGRSDPLNQTGARTSAALWPSWFIVAGPEGDNDGVVSVASARWGTFEGTIPTDHLGEVGDGTTGFDHLSFYEGIVRDLAARGH